MANIKKIIAREILDSRGYPTVEADVILTTGEIGRASVPSGASTGSREAWELRDQDKKRYLGKGVMKALAFIRHDLSNALQGFDISRQTEIDEMLIVLDGTVNKEKFGANALLAVSLAVARAAAKDNKQPLYYSLASGFLNRGDENKFILPLPMINIINGGAHADNNLDFQEFMILPTGFFTFSDALCASVEVFHTLKNLLKEKKYHTNVGDEGGFAPDLPHQEAAIEFILEAILRAGYQPEKEFYLGLDVASNAFYKNGQYYLSGGKDIFSSSELAAYFFRLVNQYPIISIEDGMAEDDWLGWQILTKALGKRIQLVGDDLFVTNMGLLKKGVAEQAANAILIKLNQIGTLTETLAVMQLAKEVGYNTIVSHRSGETEDTFIADLALATQAGQIKTGSLCRTDRVSKYNQLLRIEEALAGRVRYAGQTVFAQFDLTNIGMLN